MVEEQVAFVDQKNQLIRFGGKKSGCDGENTAVVLVVIYDPDDKKIFLFNRGAGASDMNNHWALTAGKINKEDFLESEKNKGQSLSQQTIRRAARRELEEELGVTTDESSLKEVSTFWMPNKSLVFSMLAWPIDSETESRLALDGSEVDEHKSFGLEEFRSNDRLGDAIKFKLADLISFLEHEFSR